MMEEQLSFQPLQNHILKPPFLLTETSTTTMLKRDQTETKDLTGRSSLSSKTTTGLAMSKNGNWRDIRLKPTIFGDLLILPDIA